MSNVSKMSRCVIDLPRIDPEDMAIILLSSGSTGLPKAIPYSQHALVIFACHCVNVYQTNNEDAVFYNDRAFFWAAGHPCWEIGGGKTRVTMTNALHTSSMADAVKTACKIMTREKATQAFLVPSVLDLIIKNGFPLKIQRISTGSMVVKSSMLECIGKICDEFQNIYGTTELALIGSIKCKLYGKQEDWFAVRNICDKQAHEHFSHAIKSWFSIYIYI